VAGHRDTGPWEGAVSAGPAEKPPSSASPAVRVVRFGANGLPQAGGLELVAEAPPGCSLWIDIEGDTPEHRQLLAGMGFHPLAVEDAFTAEHQPKLEEYEEFLFVIVRGVDASREQEADLPTLKLAAFLDRQRLVTYHRGPLRSVRAVRERTCQTAKPLHRGLDLLFYEICDEMMEHYFPLLDEIADEIEGLEDEIFAHPREGQLERLQALRRRLATMRRVTLPHRQVFNHLATGSPEAVDAQDALYFRDVFDKVLRLADAIDQQREMLTAAKDTYLSVLSQRTNEVMKFLTIFSSIMLPLSLIAGIYGMNFTHMPELASRWGYPLALAAMGLVAVVLVGFFRHRGWLGRPR
jgi:magnesium transporter